MITEIVIHAFSTDIGAHSSEVFGLHMPTFVLWTLALAMLAGALHTIYVKAIRPLAGLVRTIHSTYEKVMEYDVRITGVESHTRQLTRNSGAHLADAVYRIEEAQAKNRNEVEAHLEWAHTESRRIGEEVTEVWKTIAAGDMVKAALKTAEHMDHAADVAKHRDNETGLERGE